ncbi:tail fiber domain-containing protein [Enterobacter roggenkampii]|nr:tail fiber domain-containing protein [Enterobacter roggenkampii]
MLYNTGTIAINGNTATGTGTNWTAPANQIRVGQTILVLSSPVQVFQISSVDSATSLTVTPAASPALSGQKYAIMVSDIISVDGLAQAMSQLIKEYDENIGAWETFATTNSNQNITVTINGTSLSIPAIGKLLQKGSNGALPVNQGGTGATKVEDVRTNIGLGDSATRSVGTAAGTVAAGDDSRFKKLENLGDSATRNVGTSEGTVAAGNDNRLNTLEGKTGGGITGAVIAKRTSDSNPASGGELESVLQNSGGSALSQFHMFTQMAGNTRYGFLRVWDTSTFKDWYFDHSSGNAYAAAAWVNNSDRRIKDKLTPIEDVFEKMKKIRGYTWVRKDDQMKGSFGIGFVAQEVQEVFPEAVSHSREGSLTVDGQVIEKPLALSPGDVAAALHHEAILMLMSKIEELTGKVEAMQAGS